VEPEEKEQRKKMVKYRIKQNNDRHVERPKKKNKAEKWVKN